MERESVNPMGYLADNWIGANKTPALIVNPKASPIDLLAWIGGELNSLDAAARALADMACGDGASLDFGQFEAVFLHRIAPVARVLDLALCELIAQRNASSAHACAVPTSASKQGGAA